MGMIRLLAAPIRSIVRFPLFQLAVVVAIILLLQAADDNSAFGRRSFNGLYILVDASVRLCSGAFQREVLHQIGAHGRLDDWVCLSHLFANSVPRACHNQSNG